MIRTAIVGSLALALAVPTAATGAQDKPSTQATETKDRLPPEAIEALVAGPMKRVRAGRFTSGAAAFERLLAGEIAAQGTGTLRGADLLLSFGGAVYNFASDKDNGRLQAQAMPYLERAITAYREALGPGHPMLAVALHSYADAQIGLEGAGSPAAAEAALEEAHRIRKAALGPANAETLQALIDLARLRGAPAWTGKDRVKVRAAAELYRTAIELLGTEGEPKPSGRLSPFDLAEMYLRNGAAEDAITTSTDFVRTLPGRDPATACAGRLEGRLFARFLESQGYPAEAAQLQTTIGAQRKPVCKQTLFRTLGGN